MHIEYAQRRQRLMAKIGSGVAIFSSAPPAVNHADVEYNYRQDSDFYYLTGFTEPDAVAVFVPNHEEHRYILFVRPRNPAAEVWTGYRAGLEGAKELYGADIAYDISELDQKLPQYLEKSDPLYYSFGRDGSLNLRIINHYQKLLFSYGKRGTGPTAIANANLLLAPLRQRKSEYELEKMRKAIAISVEAHNQAFLSARPGGFEYEIQAQMEYHFRKSGAMGVAYPSIVASGANSCILHYVDNNAQMQDGDLLLIDAGCCYDYYNADITRTFPVGGKFTPEQKIIYELVLEAQLAAIAEVKPNHPYNHTYDVAVKIITQGLLDLGILAGDLDKLIEEKKYKPFFMHGIGHWLGMDVHDVGMYKLGETWLNMEKDMIITMEPGIYIAPDAKAEEGQPEIHDRWKGIGIRIEDDVLVTDTGNEVLTKGVPKSLEAMEK
ncbi:Xaa-Pro aminopeptidase [Synechococcus sp. PCC 7502]|uniref:aminopeptidase P N-terminal domain-containing protein n=1 Tax=Synechococcus sp. PCC 7502 TaxID=1173263 RepID=UPI00029FA229|nr:aminopeptidase P N-terminal domain-containing protein [Synechococcus sp. PCC 7502]AFY74579.1 Xaa-Pro aminopeptidase [Synechococcus sp. PCC 7502]